MSAPRPGRLTVLCVDDDRAFLDLESELLERQADDIHPVTACSGDEALDVLAEHDVDCVVSDYDMPGRNGLDLLEAVRARYPDLPFVLFTGKGSEEIASEAISAGVTDYLQKETGTDQYELLANTVRNAVEHVREATQRERAEQWYRQLFEQRLVGVAISQGGEFVQANQKFADIFGREREDVLGLSVEAVLAPADRERVLDALVRREEGAVDSVRYVVTGMRPDGERVHVEVNGGRVDYGGEPAILGLLREVDAPGATAAPDGDATESGETANLAAAARAAWQTLDPHADAVLDVDDADATLAVEEASLVAFFEEIVERTVGLKPGDCTLTVATTDDGFRVRVESPAVVDTLSRDLYAGSQPRPDPVAGVATTHGWDVLITGIDDTTVEYVLERVAFADDEDATGRET
ncbi:response regulator [Halobacterium rubrum]|uniref:response regulator n=1 Tax=Halobacterium TaxID=2239 RepID=UPI001F00B177|nr:MULTISPECIES: response regulator [Halobacterium]MDH5019482.1 response regulator [Halobacterium rubrum]